MSDVYKPDPVPLTVAAMLARYERARRKQTQPLQQGRERRRDERREERRRQKLEALYAVALADVERIAAPRVLRKRLSAADVPELAPWLPDQVFEVCLGLCTLGPQLDEHLGNLTNEDMSAAAALSEVALAWIVALTRDLHEKVRLEAVDAGLKTGPAYRPGLGKWPIECQKCIFERLPADQIGVKLTESLLMLPGFSTSVVIPIRRE